MFVVILPNGFAGDRVVGIALPQSGLDAMVTFAAFTRAIFFAAFTGVSVPSMAQQPLAVGIVEATTTTEQRRLSLTGEIRASQSLMAAFPIGGRVIEVLADIGAKVNAGMPLARLDSVQRELAVRTAEAGLVTARADHVQAIEDFERAESLLASGAGTRATRDAAEDRLSAAEGTLAQAEAERDRANKALADTVLRAPSASTVVQRMVEPGQIIGAAQSAMELALDKGIEAVFEVSEAILIEGTPAPDIELSRLSSPQDTFQGRVKEVSPLVDASTGTVEAKVEVINPPEGIGFGEPVRGTAVQIERDMVSLPYDVVSVSRAGPAVWKVDPETMQVSLHEIEIGRYESGRVLVSGGVEDGDWIVTRGSQLMYPGRTVRRAETEQ